MISGECFPGENAEILVEAIKSNYSDEDSDGITNLKVYVKRYKQTAVEATGATAVFNSTMGQYLITIPSTFVPASGIFDFVVKGDDIADVLGRIQVNVSDDKITAIKAITDLLTLSAIRAQVNASVATVMPAVLDEVIDATHHTTHGSLARLINIMYCATVGNVVNTQTSRTIKDSAGTTLVTNTLTSDTESVTRTGGHE